jgi:hypothetical protein
MRRKLIALVALVVALGAAAPATAASSSATLPTTAVLHLPSHGRSGTLLIA